VERALTPLARLFAPRSVVLVGATDKSAWSQLIHANFARLGYVGEVFLVNKRAAPAHGQPAFASCRALPSVPDIAYIFVPTEAVLDAVDDVIGAGIAHAVILSSGYAETGAAGAAAQDALVVRARADGLRLLGPNSLGFIDYARNTPVSPLPVQSDLIRGGVAIVSQSGSTTQVIAGFALQQGIGLSVAVSTGNEADVDTAQVIDYLANDPATRVITVFAETINNPPAFRAAVRKAAAADKPVIVLKVGRTELASQLAQAHTGSLTGDDRVFDAVCAQDNIVRVGSIEELVTTAGVLAHTGRVEGGTAIVSISGGACGLVADAAQTHGLDLPAFAPSTLAALAEVIASYGSTFNPLDITGAAVRDPSLFETVLTILARDPAVGLTACIYDLPRDAQDYVSPETLARIGAGLRAARTPGLLVNQSVRPVGAGPRALMVDAGIPAVTGGLDLAVRAFAAAGRWSRGAVRATEAAPASIASVTARPTSEREALDYVQRQGVHTPPRVSAPSAAGAVAAWRALACPVVLKIASPDIQHKSDIGGVRLNLDSEQAVERAFEEIMNAARAAYPDARIEGCLVMPMRAGGIELFVGTARSAWGPVIAAGLGGIWIEALADTSLRLLPITHAQARDMLGELRGARLLAGYRGAPAADLDAVAAAIRAVGDAALALGPDLVSLEVNPLLARGGEVEALDALAVWDNE